LAQFEQKIIAAQVFFDPDNAGALLAPYMSKHVVRPSGRRSDALTKSSYIAMIGLIKSS
jgi:hypothetical protein